MSLTPITKKREIYSDFHKDMLINPVSMDLARLINENAVKDSIRNLIMTDRGERLMQPNIGSDIRKMLFENITPETIILAKDIIEETIAKHEPRCRLIDVIVTSTIDSNALYIEIIFSIVNHEKPIHLNILLSRVR